MTIELTFEFNKKDKRYAYLESGSVVITVKNLFSHSINAFEAFLRFKEGPKFEIKCDARIEPNQTVILPKVKFKIDLWANDWSNFFNVGIEYRDLQNGKKWSQSKKHVQEPHDYILAIRHPSRNAKIFLSHSNLSEDKVVVTKLNNFLIRMGFTSYIAERNPKLGNHLWEKIRQEIDMCDRIVTLCTKEGAKSGDVREEMGIAIGLNKKGKIIPIVENGVTPPGSLLGMEYSDLDRDDINQSLIKTINYIIKDFEK
jgi:hypothetical protein